MWWFSEMMFLNARSLVVMETTFASLPICAKMASKSDVCSHWMLHSQTCALIGCSALRRVLWLDRALSPYAVIYSHHWTTMSASSNHPPLRNPYWLIVSRGGTRGTFRTVAVCWLAAWREHMTQKLTLHRYDASVLYKYCTPLVHCTEAAAALSFIDINTQGIGLTFFLYR